MVVDTPAGVVTVISTVPVDPAGDVAVICESLTTVKEGEALVPKSTAVAPLKPDPLRVTIVPPEVGPDVGEIEVTDGADVVNIFEVNHPFTSTITLVEPIKL